MVKIDLVTGFLGSGKTTFIKEYAKHLIEQGENIGILENDFGAVNVDMMLLQELRGQQCELEMIAGGCDADCHKRRFKTKLISMVMTGYDRVIVEPSGIFEVEEFFDLLREEPLDQWYQLENVITIIHANLETDLSKQSRYLLASQIAQSGCVLFSRGSELSKQEKEHKIQQVNAYLEEFDCLKRIAEDALFLDLKEMKKEDLYKIQKAGYISDSHKKIWFNQDEIFQSVYFMEKKMEKTDLETFVECVFSDVSCGNVFRVKGFIQENGQWYELNATKSKTELEPIENGQDVLIVIGERLSEENIKQKLK